MTTTKQSEPATLLAQLAQPSSAYKRRVWLAVAGLALFLVLYFLLAGWFLFTAYRLTLGADSFAFTGWLVGICALFLAIFMLKPVFFVKHGGSAGALEITPQQQPRLFAFLYELADSAAAPRPHKVFLSPRVNAAVFYDLSPLNLFFPSKKNLEIGLALVNALTLGEFRAVLAHEFGHFTQRSMAVGRWVYIVQQIAAHLVARRDKLDQLLETLSRLDLRVAWVGWLLRLVVWSIRSLVDSVFGVLLLLQRALSREMEMQADLVAVSLTGSDALIHALHRLQAADECWGRTLGFLGDECVKDRIARDVFTLHARMLERMGDIWSDPSYGHVAPVPAERPAEHRVFKPDLAQPPQMWLTHPLNHEREANAKRHYVGAPIDERSAWLLFDSPVAVREQVSAILLESHDKETAPIEESVAALNKQFDREYFSSRYRGVYVGRSVVRCATRPDALVDLRRLEWRQQLDQLYPESLIDDVARWRSLENEVHQLRALQSGALKPPEGVIRHRGETIQPKQLLRAIEGVEREARIVEDRLRAGDRVCRTVHLAAATELGGGWAGYLQGLLAVLHYADHTAANLQDLQGLLAHTVHVVTVTRRVSSSGMQRLLDAANALHKALADLYRESKVVTLDTSLLERLAITSWADCLGPYGLPPPDRGNIGEWLKVIDDWVKGTLHACAALRSAALEQLLLTEAAVAEHIRRGTSGGSAPSPSVVRAAYEVLLLGAERKRDTGLSWWQRFQIADGVIPATARVAVAAGIVAVVLGFGSRVGTATITVYNGLALPVVVSFDDKQWAVSPLTWRSLEVDAGVTYRVETRTSPGQVIETFGAEVRGSFAAFVYNVGGASPLVEWTAVYGNQPPRPERMLGAPRWIRSSAQVLFEKPPESISTSDSGGVRLVLSAMTDAPPGVQLRVLASDADRQRVIRAHAQWDPTNSTHAMSWLIIAQTDLPDYRQVLAARLTETPNDVVLLQLEQDGANAAEKPSVCARHQARSQAAPDDADLRYVALRCATDPVARKHAVLDGYRRWPTNGWFAYAVGNFHVEGGQWPQAIDALEDARRGLRPFAEYIAEDLARIRRLINKDAGPVIANLAKGSDHLRYLLALERGTDLASDPRLAYSELERGNLDGALKLAHADPQVEARVLRLAASSDGAGAELVSRALALGPEAGLDDDTRWASIGLAARWGRDFRPLLDSQRALRPDYVEHMLSFINRARSGANLRIAEQQLQGLPLWLRGQAYSVGVIMLGTRAPSAWRHAAKRLLFASERPYFH